MGGLTGPSYLKANSNKYCDLLMAHRGYFRVNLTLLSLKHFPPKMLLFSLLALNSNGIPERLLDNIVILFVCDSRVFVCLFIHFVFPIKKEKMLQPLL